MADDNCITCGNIVRPRQHAIQCDLCQKWNHRTCGTGISQDEYRRMMREDSISWQCSQCEMPPEEEHLDDTVPFQDSEPEMHPDTEPDTSFEISHHTIAEPVVPIESSFEANDTIDDVELDHNPDPVFSVIEEGTKRLKRKLTDSRGFTYNVKRTRKDKIDWQCSVRSRVNPCRATVRQHNDTFIPGPTQHNHHAKPGIDISANMEAQAAWTLKTRALTAQVYVDEVDVDEEGIAEMLMDDNTIAQVSRPGTSLKQPGVGQGAPSQGMRPMSQSGRPVTGFARPGTQSGRPGTMEQAIRTPRTAHTARPVTSASGRYVRLGTASMLSTPDGPFINLARLNFAKYAARPNLAKALFEYIFHHENDVRNALELAALATEACQFKDWWWKVQLAKCYYRLGMYRDAEKQLKSAQKQQDMIDIYLYLCKVYIRLDQPLTSVEVCKQGLEKFQGETTLQANIARIYEGMNDMENAVKFYKDVLNFDSMHVEAIACIATHHFYTDQPEIALKFYRRLLQMGVYNGELFNNLGLCCFYAQQYDMTLTCFERALSLSDEQTLSDVWYNIGHVALGVGDMTLAYQCFRLTLANNNDHAEAYNNLGVLELRKGHLELARAFFQAAFIMVPHMYEAHYNWAALADQLGDLQSSFNAAKRAVESFPDHVDSKDLLKQLKHHFSLL